MRAFVLFVSDQYVYSVCDLLVTYLPRFLIIHAHYSLLPVISVFMIKHLGLLHCLVVICAKMYIIYG